MDINQVGSLETLNDQKQISRRMAKTLDRLSSGALVNSAKEDPIKWNDLQGLKSAIGRMQAYSENLQRGAGSVRIALDTLEVSAGHLDEVKIVLESGLAAPQGSRARTTALERYNELHGLLDDLASPKDLGARKLLDDPARFPAAGPVHVAAGENGFEIILKNQPIHTGAGGLNLPLAGDPLPDDPSGSPLVADPANASDEEIGNLIRQVGYARELVSQKSEALAVDAGAIEFAESSNAAFIEHSESTISDLNVPDVEAEAVLAQALSIRNSLATYGLSGFEETKRLVLSLIQ